MRGEEEEREGIGWGKRDRHFLAGTASHTAGSSHLPLSNSSEVMLHCMSPVKFHLGKSQAPGADMTNFMDFN